MNIQNIIGWLLFFSIISSLGLFVGILILGTGNDYAISNLYDITEDMQNDGTFIDSRPVDTVLEANQVALDWMTHLDNAWLLAYISFSMLIFISAYFAPRLSIFSFNNILYIGSMFILFLLDIVYVVNLWIYNELFLNVLPLSETVVPKFSYFIAHLGIIVTIQIVLCILINIIDFDMVKYVFRKDKEAQVTESKELLG